MFHVTNKVKAKNYATLKPGKNGLLSVAPTIGQCIIALPDWSFPRDADDARDFVVFKINDLSDFVPGEEFDQFVTGELVSDKAHKAEVVFTISASEMWILKSFVVNDSGVEHTLCEKNPELFKRLMEAKIAVVEQYIKNSWGCFIDPDFTEVL